MGSLNGMAIKYCISVIHVIFRSSVISMIIWPDSKDKKVACFTNELLITLQKDIISVTDKLLNVPL